MTIIIHYSLRGRNGRALDKTQTKQLDDDDTNDFNDDFSIYDTLRTEGNITKDEEGRAKGMKGYKGNKKQGYGYDEDRDGWSYGGYGNKLTLAFFVQHTFPHPPSLTDQKNFLHTIFTKKTATFRT